MVNVVKPKSINSDLANNFRGYHQSQTSEIDEAIALIEPGTPCGEFFRRYWHPVALTSEIANLPLPVCILGENLVLFRTTKGDIGLVHKHCPHRRASLVFGKCEERGIRCCYHGWLFATDGEILETPGEASDSKPAENIRSHLRLGAYPVIEFNGLVFTYMGPPDEIPEFPHYDSFFTPGITMRPYRVNYDCNWLQVLDAIMDPIHTSFLHSQISHTQFSEGLGEIGELEVFERGIQFLGSSTRRVNDYVWVRVNELFLPNFTQAGSAFAADGTKSRFFGRSSFTRWVVPVDNTHSMCLAWGNFGERGDPEKYNSQEGCELIEQGEIVNRTLEERQNSPSDAEAVEGMGPISTHRGEHLMPTDRGISLYRRKIRQLIQDLTNGKRMPQPQQISGEAVRTNGQDTVLLMPQNNENDREFLKVVGSTVLNLQFDSESMPLDERDNHIINQLSKMEKNRKL
jgi:phenylpropionate dioxygenase-like ring-hydroxylating dioxygenase large terminal subunit